MEKYRGSIICGGIAIGKILVWTKEKQAVQSYQVNDIEAEIARYEEAKRIAIRHLNTLHEKALAEVGEADAVIFEMHAMLLQDIDYNESICSIIRKNGVNAESAVTDACDKFFAMFSEMKEEVFRARAVDIKDISKRLVDILSGDGRDEAVPRVQNGEPDRVRSDEWNVQPDNESIILATDDLTPGDFIQLDKSKVSAIVTKHVSFYSHTGILARNMGIPMLTQVDIQKDWDGEIAIVDAKRGSIFVSPDAAILEKYTVEKDVDNNKKILLAELKGKPDVTKDGRGVKLYANIDNTADVEAVLVNDAAGIGLFRSEFLYLERSTYPTEEEQFAVYKAVAQRMAGKKVVIRTLDIGADKQVDYFKLEKEENPALGFRGIRVCLEQVDMFKTQLRAIYRASAFGNVDIMFPMVISVEEVRQVKKICEEVKVELSENQISYGEVELGIMIETPAAVVISDLLAKEVDFVSIGTNDLTQYALAADRQNTKLSTVYDSQHPAILRMIQMVIDNGHKEGCRVGICGELASDTSLTEQFIKMGIDELSVSPDKVLPIRQIIRESTYSE